RTTRPSSPRLRSVARRGPSPCTRSTRGRRSWTRSSAAFADKPVLVLVLVLVAVLVLAILDVPGQAPYRRDGDADTDEDEYEYEYEDEDEDGRMRASGALEEAIELSH